MSATPLAPSVVAVSVRGQDAYESVTAIVVSDTSRTTGGMVVELVTSHGPPIKEGFVFSAKPVDGTMPTAPKYWPEKPIASTPLESAERRTETPSAPPLPGLETVTWNVIVHDASVGTWKGAQAAPA